MLDRRGFLGRILAFVIAGERRWLVAGRNEAMFGLIGSMLASGAEVEARVGGRYELFWQPEDPENNSTIGCRITALVPGQMIAFQWRSPVQFKGFAKGADPLTHVVVSFHEQETGTRVHLTHSGWRSDASWEEARAWQSEPGESRRRKSEAAGFPCRWRCCVWLPCAHRLPRRRPCGDGGRGPSDAHA